jgi:RimJ/RimL family protein N-acetyltransferase
MRIFLETARLVLREFIVSDVENLVCLDSDPEVMRYLTKGRPTPREVIESETLPRILRTYERCDCHGRWAVVEKSGGQFAGWLGLGPHPDGGADQAELGYRLRRSAWGKGYATEGSRALIRKAFTESEVRRVWAQTMAVNIASRRVLTKAGLTWVRTFYPMFDDPIDGSELGDVEYALHKATWEQRQAPA